MSHNSNLLLSLPVSNGRRASDGGSNISLFNQFYSLKNGYHLANRRNNPNCDSIRSSFTNEDSYNHEDEAELNNIAPDDKDNSNDDEIDNDANYPPTSKIFQSRGSITSGIPIFSVTSAQGNTNTTLGSQSSGEDEEVSPYNGSNSMKFQRRSSKSRHEPYMDNSSVGYVSNQSSPPYRSRQRESFSGTNNERFSNRAHRGSEPNALDLIFANRTHLERIYNQSISKANKDFKMLKQQQESLQNNVDLGLSESLILCSQLQTLSTLANDLNGQTYHEEMGVARPCSPNISNSFLTSLSLANYDQEQKESSGNGNTNNAEESGENCSNELKLLQSNMNELNMNPNLNSLQMIQEEQNEIQMLSSESSSISSSASTTPRMNRSTLVINRRSSFANSLEYDNEDASSEAKQKTHHHSSHNKGKFSLQAVNQPTKVDYYNNSIYNTIAQSGQQYFNNFNFAYPHSAKFVNENGMMSHNHGDLSGINENETSTALFNSLTKSNGLGQSVNTSQNETVNLSEAIIE